MKGRLLNIKPLSLVKKMSESAFHLDALKMANSVPYQTVPYQTRYMQFSFQIHRIHSQVSKFQPLQCQGVSASSLSGSSLPPDTLSMNKMQWYLERDKKKAAEEWGQGSPWGWLLTLSSFAADTPTAPVSSGKVAWTSSVLFQTTGESKATSSKDVSFKHLY